MLLTQAREEKGISVNKLAWMADVSPKGIAFIEQGRNSPTLRNVCRLADALDVSLPALFAAADEMVPRGKGD
jgi:transcriptional regulator with XRE-family HTH domain